MRTLPLLALLAVACNEYELFGKEVDEDPPEDTGVTGTGGTPVDSGEPPPTCPTQDLPGFETSVDEACVNEVQTGTFTPIEEWSVRTFPSHSTFNNVMMQPIVVSLNDDDGDGDIDTDDTPDVLVTTYSGSAWTSAGVLRALSGANGAELWSDKDAGIEGSGGIAAGDIDSDGVVEIIAVKAAPKQVVAFEHDGTVKWTSSTLSLTGCYAAAPALGDLTGDGSPEIIVGNVALDASGAVLWTGAGTNGGCTSFPIDLDGDGTAEVLAGGTVYDHTGAVEWSIPGEGYPAAADINGDGDGDLILVDSAGSVSAYTAGGTVLWKTATALGYGPPTVADFDGDGAAEVGVAGRSTYTVIDSDGTTLWQNATTDASSGRTGSSVFDFEGDGAAEVIYADEYALWVYSGVNGSVKLQETDHTSWTWIEYATVADVDGDGEVEIILPNGDIAGNPSGAVYGVTVIGDADNSWMPGRKIWNQHAYNIVNVTDSGGIPASPPSNWPLYNSFRSGDLTEAVGTDAPDAVLTLGDFCEVECEDGRLVAWVHVGNAGLSELSRGGTLEVALVDAAGSTVVDTRDVTDILSPGQMRSSFEIDLQDVVPEDLTAIEVTFTPDGLECNEDNNVLRIEGPFCAE